MLVGGAGYLAGGNANGVANGGAGNGGGYAHFAGAIFDMLRGAQPHNDGEEGARPGRTRPAAWESFEAHREWQTEEDAERQSARNPATEEVQKVIDGLMGQMRGAGLWGMAQGVASSFIPRNDGTRERRKRPHKQRASEGA